jgi:hypothetical protein
MHAAPRHLAPFARGRKSHVARTRRPPPLRVNVDLCGGGSEPHARRPASRQPASSENFQRHRRHRRAAPPQRMRARHAAGARRHAPGSSAARAWRSSADSESGESSTSGVTSAHTTAHMLPPALGERRRSRACVYEDRWDVWRPGACVREREVAAESEPAASERRRCSFPRVRFTDANRRWRRRSALRHVPAAARRAGALDALVSKLASSGATQADQPAAAGRQPDKPCTPERAP